MNVSTRLSTNRAWVVVDLGNIRENARTVQAAAGGASLLPVVKADAYGVGAVPVARALEPIGPWGYAVATVDESTALRRAGIRRPILVFTPATMSLLPEYREHALRAVLDDPTVGAQWPEPFHLEIDTGMGRCGVRWDDDRLPEFATAHLEGAFTHFFAADERPETISAQWARFERAIDRLGTRPPLLHAANSAAAWRLAQRLDLVRPGIFLYGGRAAPDLPRPRAAVTVKAPVVSVRRLPQGESVSYGGEWCAPVDTTIATLGIGYADGVPRSVERRAEVLLGGRRRPIVGRVTMDFVMVDLGPSDKVRVGDVATLVGRDGDEEITIDEFAEWSGTISYESLTRLTARLPREAVGP